MASNQQSPTSALRTIGLLTAAPSAGCINTTTTPLTSLSKAYGLPLDELIDVIEMRNPDEFKPQTVHRSNSFEIIEKSEIPNYLLSSKEQFSTSEIPNSHLLSSEQLLTFGISESPPLSTEQSSTSENPKPTLSSSEQSSTSDNPKSHTSSSEYTTISENLMLHPVSSEEYSISENPKSHPLSSEQYSTSPDRGLARNGFNRRAVKKSSASKLVNVQSTDDNDILRER